MLLVTHLYSLLAFQSLVRMLLSVSFLKLLSDESMFVRIDPISFTSILQQMNWLWKILFNRVLPPVNKNNSFLLPLYFSFTYINISYSLLYVYFEPFPDIRQVVNSLLCWPCMSNFFFLSNFMQLPQNGNRASSFFFLMKYI